MKKTYCLLIALFVTAGCGKTDKSLHEDNDLIEVDVTKNYGGMSISINVDINSVEYIPLETNDDFLCSYGKIVAFTDELIIYVNDDYNGGGDILIFDAKGKALKKINRKGQSGEEYEFKMDVVYDDNSRELFVNDAGLSKIFVYDLDGNYKRSFQYLTGIEFFTLKIGNFDDESLLCYTSGEKTEHPWFLISKQTGEKIQDILIPVKEKASMVVSTEKRDNGNTAQTILNIKHAVNNGDSLILNEPSSDTIYSIGKDRILKPLLVRSPAVSSMNPQVLLTVEAKIGDFLFMKSYNKGNISDDGHRIIPFELVYSYKENKLYKCSNNLYFHTYNSNLITFPLSTCIIHNVRKNVIVNNYSADFLKNIYDQQDNKEGFSKKYKEMISKIEEDSNPVLVKINLGDYSGINIIKLNK